MCNFFFYWALYFFMKSNHPLISSISLMGVSVSIIPHIFSFLGSAWFSYIIVLVYLGGMMMLFIYVSSLTPSFFMNPGKVSLLVLSGFFFFSIFHFFFSFSWFSNPKMFFFSSELIFLMLILLFSMVAISKISFSPFFSLFSFN